MALVVAVAGGNMIYLLAFMVIVAIIALPAVRCALCHPIATPKNAAIDLYYYIKYRKRNNYQTGDLNIYCGYFGAGKTLSLVHKVVGIYNKYEGLPVWDNTKKKFVTQRILVLSNVNLSIPYKPLKSLSQVVAAGKVNAAYDEEHDTLTCTIVCMDELSVQMNSRSFKNNIDAYFLNTLLCCRHYHISFYGSAQRFQHVDKLLRDVTRNVIQCKKVWRFQLLTSYDAWELENATNPDMIQSTSKKCWFVFNRDYNNYDTLAVVENLQKKYDEGDMLTEQEILLKQAPTQTGIENVTNVSRTYKRRMKGK